MSGGLSSFNKALVTIPCVTGSVSFLSSALLLYILKRSDKPGIKRKLLASFCLSDLLLSASYAFSTFMGPTDMSENAAFGGTFVGSDATCRAQASMVQLGLSQPSYNAALCVYYMLMICHPKIERRISRWFLPIVHALIISYNVSGVVLGNILHGGVFHPAGILGCSFADPCQGLHAEVPETQDGAGNAHIELPSLCEDAQGIDPISIRRLQFAFVVGPVVLNFVIIAACMTSIYWSIKRVEDKASRWSFDRYTFEVQQNTATDSTSWDNFCTSAEMIVDEEDNDHECELEVASGDGPSKQVTRSCRREARGNNGNRRKSRKRNKPNSQGARDVGLQYGM